jgi:hypothetical protein
MRLDRGCEIEVSCIAELTLAVYGCLKLSFNRGEGPLNSGRKESSQLFQIIEINESVVKQFGDLCSFHCGAPKRNFAVSGRRSP